MVDSSRNWLEQFQFTFVKALKAFVYVGAEIEFYLRPLSEDSTAQPIDAEALAAFCQEYHLPIERIDQEAGELQFEAVFSPVMNGVTLCDQIIQFKQGIAAPLKNLGYRVDFSAVPMDGQIGNGMHFHLSLLTVPHGQNLYQKSSSKEDETASLKASVAGLLATMPESMIFFCPQPEALKRFISHVSVAARMCWGGNNRTVALRLPDCTLLPEKRRIEHRIASADADPYLVLSAIMVGIHYGMTQQLTVGPKVHGNAFDKMYGEAPYNYPPFPRDYNQVLQWSKEGVILEQYELKPISSNNKEDAQ
ncbi:MAG: hypothetical protein IPP74_05515 [Alphaproteobacteria bacterium]|nr:hypothetical protein [Alphaproteobacteria bacterium]